MLIALALHVVLAFEQPASIGPAVVRDAVAEAAVIWGPYGLVVDGQGPCSGVAADTPVLAVRIAGTGIAGPTATVLGAIVFGPDGRPEPRITVFMEHVLRFVASARVFDSPQWQWPVRLREQITGRVLGRVLAHEIGHYVLRNRQHAAAGLMRSFQRSDELAAPSRGGFKLTPDEIALLKRGPAI